MGIILKTPGKELSMSYTTFNDIKMAIAQELDMTFARQIEQARTDTKNGNAWWPETPSQLKHLDPYFNSADTGGYLEPGACWDLLIAIRDIKIDHYFIKDFIELLDVATEMNRRIEWY